MCRFAAQKLRNKRLGRKRKSLYDNNGSKIKYPKGFFSQLTANERGQWTNRTKKQYNIGPYSLDDEETVNARIDHRRTREAENKRKPLSDERLKDMLQQRGYNIARRTVAKYREQLNIPVARLRKEL